MTRREAAAQFDSMVQGNSDIALDKCKSAIAWLEYVAGSEFQGLDRRRIIFSCRSFYAAIQPLSSKYIDREEQHGK
jgi:predicted RNA-binding protein with EMAP domain